MVLFHCRSDVKSGSTWVGSRCCSFPPRLWPRLSSPVSPNLTTELRELPGMSEDDGTRGTWWPTLWRSGGRRSRWRRGRRCKGTARQTAAQHQKKAAWPRPPRRTTSPCKDKGDDFLLADSPPVCLNSVLNTRAASQKRRKMMMTTRKSLTAILLRALASCQPGH